MKENPPRVLVYNEWLQARVAGYANGDFETVGPKDDEDKLAWLTEHGPGISVIIALGIDRWDRAMFDRLPDLKRVVVLNVGMDAMDVDEMNRRGMIISNTSEISANEVADHAVAMMLAARRGIVEGDRWVRENRWIDEGRQELMRSVIGAKVGIAGLGWIGKAIARRVKPFTPEIAWWGPRVQSDVSWPRCETLLDLARWCDILLVAVRGCEETRHLVNREIIEAVGSDGLIVNVSRGFVVEEEALIAALREARLGQAALDVFDPEPTGSARWRGVPNILLQPHVGGATRDSSVRLTQHSVEQVREFLTSR